MAWDLLEHGVFARGELERITFQYIVSGPGHLLMATGFAVSCIPTAIEVALAAGKYVPEAEAEIESERDLEAAGFWPGAAAGDIESWR